MVVLASAREIKILVPRLQTLPSAHEQRTAVYAAQPAREEIYPAREADREGY
jgi:hypothetical protein